ncbi:MAG TPA: putative Fe-S cluster assembly protein SufT [Pusillimonas sp.]|uniref:putative Fe-S cluster assembly protein SufT n=1 Tax=Pusillimonas sp. TaxID=3040095 RepID=UPI002BEC5F47|nr:putative Fe-S cluster assembly protein SufT [Pusillimonas sp.]HUH86969.1 putative Fe-S cluster assembly protein SufT [Pusillimonas sp.]
MYHNQRPNEVIVSRDCPAVSVPFGEPVTIQEGCKAQITQQLGGSYTVYVEGNLYRIEGRDADALGLEPIEAPSVPAATGPVTAESIEASALELLATCYDPEIPVDIVNLGLVYRCEVVPTADPDKFRIEVDMTLTAPGCGMGTFIADEARAKLLSIAGVDDVSVDLVWDPPWSREMISEHAKLELGLM